MKKLIILLIVICSFQMVNSQNIDQATSTKIRVKKRNAEDLLNQGKYYDVISKVKEIEELVPQGYDSPESQNYKVKAYIGLGQYERAKKELEKLYNMNPNDEVIDDIASYESSINDGIAEEIVRKERARLAKIKRKEDSRLAEIKRKEDAELAEVKRKEIKRRAELSIIRKDERKRLKKEEELSVFKDWYKNKYGTKKVNTFYKKSKYSDYGVVDSDFNVIIPFKYKEIKHTIDDIYMVEIYDDGTKYGFVDVAKGIEISKPIYEERNGEINFSDEGLLRLQYKGKYGFVDKRGQIKIPFNLDLAEDFSEGFARVGIHKARSLVYPLFGYINTKGNIIIPIIYDWGRSFSEGLVAVEKGGKDGKGWGYLNTNGEVVINFKYWEAESFKNGKAKVEKKRNSGEYYINKKGKKL